MAGKIPDDTLQAIRERVSIVEVISGYVSLKKPDETTPVCAPFTRKRRHRLRSATSAACSTASAAVRAEPSLPS